MAPVYGTKATTVQLVSLGPQLGLVVSPGAYGLVGGVAKTYNVAENNPAATTPKSKDEKKLTRKKLNSLIVLSAINPFTNLIHCRMNSSMN